MVCIIIWCKIQVFACAGTFKGVDVGNITIALVYGMHAPFCNPPVSLYRGLTSCCVSTPSARMSNVCITTNAPLHECVSLGMYVYKCMLVCVFMGEGAGSYLDPRLCTCSLWPTCQVTSMPFYIPLCVVILYNKIASPDGFPQLS